MLRRRRCFLFIYFISILLLSHFIPLKSALSKDAHASDSAMGVGYKQESVEDPATGRIVPVDVFIPISLRLAAQLPIAQIDFIVPFPFCPGGLCNFSEFFNFHIGGDLLVAALGGGDPVRALGDSAVETSRVQDRAIIFLPGNGAPGAVFYPGAIELARKTGFVVFVATDPFVNDDPNHPGYPDLAGLCLLEGDAKAIVDHIVANDGFSELYGMGHSIGGRTWIARVSDAQHCNLTPEARLRGIIPLDGTWESTFIDQTTHAPIPALMFSQNCRYTQMKMQTEIASGLDPGPVRIDLEGLPAFFGLGSIENHLILFVQTCVLSNVLQASGFPLPPPPDIAQACQTEGAPEIEQRSMEVVRNYIDAFTNHISRGAPKRFPPGGQPDEPFAHIIAEPPEQPAQEGQFANFCFGVPGHDPAEEVLVDFSSDQILPARQF